MKSILVPIEITDAMQAALETALLLAKHREAYIEGFPLRFGISEFATAEVVGGFPSEAYRQYGVQEAEQTQKLFEGFMAERGVPLAGESLGLAYGWLDDAPEGEGFVGSYGRAFDVTVLSRPDTNSIGLHTRAIESSLFESGRPLLLAPPQPPKTIATNIMIHWNGSTEQARANAFAMPLLRAAERVSVLTVVGGQGVAGTCARRYHQAAEAQRHRREADPGRDRKPQYRRGRPCRRKGGRLRPSGQGRLHPQPVAAAGLRRRHQPHHGPRRAAGADGALRRLRSGKAGV